ncbi:hypothetical protein EPUS_06489 [Endocarpon pusillum Z07020]|uniref:Uncharacterized protein n=1 Tax=Endocarpon pusillum (strain Z07020 / HMAS-L-300199) TaxID=1263415 RepID=U1HNI8_ENDPU|nr:uncharacterized protein EPUS_06489 [Endocarpon pusillum Z07020]ERF71930.1 hypothetical protein EPUS_06489 [Endocarpon pusillum Z07020]
MAEQYEFDIDLFDGGTPGSAYHMSNLPGEDQRHYLAQYGSTRTVKGILTDVVHGHLTSGGDAATLIVSTFKFLGSTRANRFVSANITWEFFYADPAKPGVAAVGLDDWPEVVNLSMDDQFVMDRETFTLSKDRSLEAGLQGGAFGASTSISSGWTRSESGNVHDHISLYGSSIFPQRNAGEPTGAKWVMEENATGESGIPDTLTTAVLLRRKPGKRFIGVIDIKAKQKLDLSSRIAQLVSTKPKVSPIRFDPALKATTDKYEPDELEKVVLDDINIVRFKTELPKHAA